MGACLILRLLAPGTSDVADGEDCRRDRDEASEESISALGGWESPRDGPTKKEWPS